MILLLCVDVLHVHFVVYQRRDGTDKIPARCKHLKHRPPLAVKSQPVVILHLSCQPRIVPLIPVDKVGTALHHGGDALPLALVEDCRVRHAADRPPPQHRVVLFRLAYLLCLRRRVHLHAFIRLPGAPVQLLDPVDAPLLVHRVPPHRERLGKAEVVSPPDAPVCRYGERVYYMRPPLVLIVCWVVPPFGEHLPRKAVPTAIQQRLLFGFRQAGQVCQVARVILQKFGVIKHSGRDKDAGAPHLLVCAVRPVDRLVHHHPHAGRRWADKPPLYPSMTYPAGVGRGPYVYTRPRPCRPVPAHDVAVFLPREVGQLVDADKVECKALVVVPVLCPVHTAEIDFRPARKGPDVCAGVVLCPWEHWPVVAHRLVDQVFQLWESLAQDQRPVMGYLHLPQRLYHQRVAFTAPGGTAVQCLVLRPGHKGKLPRLRFPYHRSIHPLPPLPPARCPAHPGTAPAVLRSLPSLPVPQRPALPHAP